MPIGEVCTRQVVIAPAQTPISEAAKLMRQHHVGALVITEGDGKRVPAGIVTDRDIVVGILAQDLDPDRFTLGDITTGELVTIREQEGVFETIQLMRSKGVRRVPVVDAKGTLVGIVSIDDLVDLLAEELGELAKLISREQKREAEVRL